MIQENQVLPMLVNASPSFTYLASNDYEEPNPQYLIDLMMSFSLHVGDMIISETGLEVDNSFSVIEELMKNGTEQVGDSVVYFFLEGIWAHLRNSGIKPSVINKWIGPETKYWLRFLQEVIPEAMTDRLPH